MTENIPTLTHAIERDVDLLLVEELKVSEQFVTWIVNELSSATNVNIPFDTWDVKHSRRRIYHRREIDIYVELHYQNQCTHVLIENKLDTMEQPNQAESYLEECSTLVQEGHSNMAFCMLVCPDSYHNSHKMFADKFHAFISYEDISKHFKQRAGEVGGELQRRLSHRFELMNQAIHKNRRGYKRIPLIEVGSFDEQYVSLCHNLAPMLIPGKKMLSPASPHGSNSMIFDQKEMFDGKNVSITPRRFVHELGKGTHDEPRTHYAALTIAGWGNYLNELQDEFENDLQGSPYSLKAKKPTRNRQTQGLVLFAPTPPVFHLEGFNEQRDAIEQGILITDELRNWFLINQLIFQKWSKQIQEL